MDSLNTPKTTFMSNYCDYYYNGMPFGPNNTDVIYQRFMDIVFSHQTGKNLEANVDDMIVKTKEDTTTQRI